MASPPSAQAFSLCEGCRSDPEVQVTNNLRVCAEASVLKDSDYNSQSFLKEILKLVSAVRNMEGANPWEVPWKIVEIHLMGKHPAAQHLQLFLDKIGDKLNNLVQGSCFSENFSVKVDGNFIYLHIRAYNKCLSTVDYKSPESTDKGLLSLSLERFHDVLYNPRFCVSGPTQQGGTEGISRHSRLKRELYNGKAVDISESSHIQLKSLAPGQKENKKVQQGLKPEEFDPQSGREYVRWLWEKFPKTVGEYIAAFAKNPEGGWYYCGIKEETPSGPKGPKVNKVKALSLSDKWKEELHVELRRRIQEDLMWVESNDVTGYKILRPDEIKEGTHFAMRFLPVQGEAPAGHSLYVLEVQTAPFRGIIFCSKEGPECYKFGVDGRTPDRVTPQEWLHKTTGYGWCYIHKQKKEIRCGTASQCSKCQKIEDKGCIKTEKLPSCNQCPT